MAVIINVLKRFCPYILTILASTAVFVVSVIPIPEVPELGDVPLMDKWVHFVMYGGVALASWLDIRRGAPVRRWWHKTLLCVVWPIALGGLLELWQAYLTTCRSGDWMDFLADAIGVAIALPIGVCIGGNCSSGGRQ